MCANPEQMLLENTIDTGPGKWLFGMKAPSLGQT